MQNKLLKNLKKHFHIRLLLTFILVNLAIDIGNTRIKAGVFKENHLFEVKYYTNTQQLLNDTTLLHLVKYCVIGTVVNDLDFFLMQLNSKFPTLVFKSNTKIPIQNNYQSLSTLGSDRLAASIGAFYLHKHKNVLVVDVGTCIKYNFVNLNNEYLGGGISPGLQMRFKALSEHTSKLPLVNFLGLDVITLIGNTTQQSILSGVVNGTVAEIDGIIGSYKSIYPNVVSILTGGDSEYLCKQLKNSIFAHQNLVLKGLNDILNYNLENKYI